MVYLMPSNMPLGWWRELLSISRARNAQVAGLSVYRVLSAPNSTASNPTDPWRPPTYLVRWQIPPRGMGAAGGWGAEGLMTRWPSSYCLFKLHWWEGDDNRGCLGIFPLSGWLGRNRCLNGTNIWMWVFKWGYKTQEKEQLQVVELGRRSWLDPAPDKALKSPTHLFVNHLPI